MPIMALPMYIPIILSLTKMSILQNRYDFADKRAGHGVFFFGASRWESERYKLRWNGIDKNGSLRKWWYKVI